IPSLLILEMLATTGKRMSELLAPLEQTYFISGEINSTVPDPKASMQALAEHYRDGQVEWVDGVSVTYPDWHFNVRASNTETLLAVAIDSTDGMLARRYRVKEMVPEFDGRRMDDIVDYISYVFLPVVFMLKAGMLLEPALVFGSLPLLASVFGFGRVDAKLDEEGFFLGFPSYWNVVVAYFYLIGTPPWLNTVVIVLLAALVFVPT